MFGEVVKKEPCFIFIFLLYNVLTLKEKDRLSNKKTNSLNNWVASKFI